ncbi:hypothetical protein Acr_23g0008580 [Actinidia rufa]|uniref:Uncharacterized protein n=1 Tax=Actinidia rufa TaxID=165716 RepID=A0A7J0GNW8_9ERIC|nr:hypothetical protein Acr_23g0008580 [Actinidia rufa]
METLSPKTSPGWAEVPSPGATIGATPLLATFFLAQMTMHLAAEVVALEPFAILMSFYTSIFLNMDVKGNMTRFISGMMELTLVTRNLACTLYKFILGIVSTIGRHLFTTKGKALAKCLGTEDRRDQEESSRSYFLQNLVEPLFFRVDNTSPRVRNKLSRADIVEVQYSPNSGVDRKMKAGMERSLISGHLSYAIQFALSHDAYLPLKWRSVFHLGIFPVVRRFFWRGGRELVYLIRHDGLFCQVFKKTQDGREFSKSPMPALLDIYRRAKRRSAINDLHVSLSQGTPSLRAYVIHLLPIA